MARVPQSRPTNYVPGRIKMARIMNGYSMSELATLLSLTPQAISQYELGLSRPSDAVMLKMTNLLDFPIEFFMKSLSKEDYAISASFFRRKKTVSVKQRNAFEEKTKLVTEIVDYLSEYIDFPDVNLPNISDFSITDDINPIEMDGLTSYVRKFWKISDGPIENVSDILQQHGIIISRIDHTNAKMDAFSNWKDARPFIYLNTARSSLRDRFDMAHELGHLLMHTKYTDDDLSDGRLYDIVEKQANLFASSFLMQSKEFFKEVVTSSIDRLLVIKRIWKVSVSSMIYKIQDFNILSDYQIDYLKRQMTERHMWREEPFDDIADYDAPDVLKQAIDVILEEGMASVSDINNSIPFHSWRTEAICCLPTGYLTSKQETHVRPKLRLL